MAAIPPNALDDDEEDGRCEDLRAKAFLAKRPPRPEKPPPPLEDEGGGGAGWPPPIFRTMSDRIIPRERRLRSRRIGGRLEKEEKADWERRKKCIHCQVWVCRKSKLPAELRRTLPPR